MTGSVLVANSVLITDVGAAASDADSEGGVEDGVGGCRSRMTGQRSEIVAVAGKYAGPSAGKRKGMAVSITAASKQRWTEDATDLYADQYPDRKGTYSSAEV